MKLLVSFFVLTLLVACSSPSPIAEDIYHRLEINTSEMTASQSEAKYEVIYLHPIKFVGILQDDMLIYQQNGVFHEWFGHLWAEPPADVLGRKLAKELRHSGISQMVSQRPQSGMKTKHMYVSVTAFEYNKDEQKAYLSFDVEMFARKNNSEHFVKSYQYNVQSSSSKPRDVVASLSRGVEQFIAELTGDL